MTLGLCNNLRHYQLRGIEFYIVSSVPLLPLNQAGASLSVDGLANPLLKQSQNRATAT